jgi:hypothetical protein
MKTEKFNFNVETAYGQTLSPAIPVSGEFEAYEKYEEIPAKELPDNDDVLKFVNAKNKAAARAKATNEALQKAGIEKPTAKDNSVAIKEMMKIFKLRGDSDEVAESKAKAALGL